MGHWDPKGTSTIGAALLPTAGWASGAFPPVGRPVENFEEDAREKEKRLRDVGLVEEGKRIES